jgi:TolA-binding protein
LFLAAFSARGAVEPLQPPVPLLAEAGAASPGSALIGLAAADRALAMGLPSVASGLYERLLAAPAVTAADPNALRLSLASALMEEGRLDEARKALDACTGQRGAEWKLRSALLAAILRRADLARSEAAGIRVEELPAPDRAWFPFLQGLLADLAGNIDQGRDFYEQAVRAADSELSRVRFVLARELAFLRRGVGNLDTLRANAEQYQGRKVGYGAARMYGVGLNAAGRKAEAVSTLQRLLQALPTSEQREIDEARLLLGMIDGAAQGSSGRNALFRLLENGQDGERQRIAVLLLARASSQGASADEFRVRLDRLLAQKPPHPVSEHLLLARAEAALAVREYARAEDDARALLDRFPGSPLRVNAFGVLAGAAWEQSRFRLAADYAEKARAALGPGAAHARLGVVVAEAWYRATDYRSAAEAYGAALRELPAGMAPGPLFFQRIQSEIDADRLDSAQPLLDELARDTGFDTANRWQAEWNLARALQAADRRPAAYSRINALLAAGSALPSDPTLRARMRWLQARLALDARQPADALRLAAAIPASLDGLPETLRADIASSSTLIRAQAEFALNQPDTALASLAKLRADFPKSDAAVFSIITEADYFISLARTVDAQQRLTRLADDYKTSAYAPYALYRAALLAESRGQDSNYTEANNLIELLVSRYPRSDLVFYARLKQGDLFRKLNEFAPAERAYDYLVKTYPKHGDILAARISLADCHAAQAGADPAHADRALELYEGIVARPDASADLRIEAACKLGAAYARRGDAARAAEVWWRDAIGGFLDKPERAALLREKGRYWMARTLFDLAALLERQGKHDEARRALQLVADSKLTPASAELARARISQLAQAKPDGP